MNLVNLYKRLPYVFIIIAFGPYIHLGIGLRIEHLVIYPLFLLFVFISLMKKQLMLKNMFVLFSVWLITVVFLVIRTVFGGVTVPFVSLIAEVDSVFQPLAVMGVFLFLTIKLSRFEAKNRLIAASQILIVMLSLNSIWSMANLFIDFSSVNSFFWGSREGSVAANAITNGRFSGIFNQPMEAGVMYSLGLFSWVYLSENINIFKLKYTGALFLMVIGGLLTVSKVFLFGGLGLFVLGILFNKRIWKLVFSLTFWSLIIGVPAFYFLTKTWGGLNYLMRFFSGTNRDFIYLLTAGRFGENSQQYGLFSGVWDKHPLIGSGFGQNPVYDSGFFYFFANGGSIGLALYITILSLLSLVGLRISVNYKKQSETKFFNLILILLLGANFGTPVLTLNRVSIVIWVFVCLLIQYFYFAKMNYGHSINKFQTKKKVRKKLFKRYKVVW